MATSDPAALREYHGQTCPVSGRIFAGVRAASTHSPSRCPANVYNSGEGHQVSIPEVSSRQGGQMHSASSVAAAHPWHPWTAPQACAPHQPVAFHCLGCSASWRSAQGPHEEASETSQRRPCSRSEKGLWLLHWERGVSAVLVSPPARPVRSQWVVGRPCPELPVPKQHRAEATPPRRPLNQPDPQDARRRNRAATRLSPNLGEAPCHTHTPTSGVLLREPGKSTWTPSEYPRLPLSHMVRETSPRTAAWQDRCRSVVACVLTSPQPAPRLVSTIVVRSRWHGDPSHPADRRQLPRAPQAQRSLDRPGTLQQNGEVCNLVSMRRCPIPSARPFPAPPQSQDSSPAPQRTARTQASCAPNLRAAARHP
mmetsp:Transcript_29615/g.78424  ORF Transcript_29615/g.78424 Transcript_29615/m.78424 type:complete len:367 (+) Transcript_29615:1045-2145(+)